MLSHGTAIWWLDLLKYPPLEIHVSTPRRVRDLDNIVAHGREARTHMAQSPPSVISRCAR